MNVSPLLLSQMTYRVWSTVAFLEGQAINKMSNNSRQTLIFLLLLTVNIPSVEVSLVYSDFASVLYWVFNVLGDNTLALPMHLNMKINLVLKCPSVWSGELTLKIPLKSILYYNVRKATSHFRIFLFE